MNSDQIVLARKYATAFLNLFIDEIGIKDFCAIVSVDHFLKSAPEISSFFKFSGMNETKKEVIDRIFQEFKLTPVLKRLTELLLRHQRLFLLQSILHCIKQLYKERRGIMEFSIQSSPVLTKEQITTIKNFLSAKTGCHILYEYKENKNLIAGVRVQSDNVLWERSVARRLVEVQRLLQP